MHGAIHRKVPNLQIFFDNLLNSPDTCVLPAIDPQLGSTMHPGSIFCSVQVALVLLSSGMDHPVSVLFSELLLACTMAPLPRTCGVSWGKLPVECGLYSLLSSLNVDLIPSCLERLSFCSVEPALVPTASSSLFLQCRSYLCTNLLEHFVLET